MNASLFLTSILFIVLFSTESKAGFFDRHHRCERVFRNNTEADLQLTSRAQANFIDIFRKTLAFHKDNKEAHELREDRFSFIDFSLPSNARRYFLINLENCTYRADFVGHGSGTGSYRNGKKWLRNCAKGSARASRRNLTRKGFYKYTQFHSSSKNWPRISGRYKGIQLLNLNDNRADDDVNNGNVVIHEASYVHNRPVDQGRSHGCYAFARTRLRDIAQNLIGGLVYAHAPQCK